MDENKMPVEINYETPQVRTGQLFSFFSVGFLAFILGLLGLYAMFAAAQLAIALREEWQRWHYVDEHDVTAGVMFFVIGCVCLYVAIRWVRKAARRRNCTQNG